MLDVQSLVKYLLEGLAVAAAAYYIPRKTADLKEIGIIAVTAAAVFAVLDQFSPSVSGGARHGAGFGIGYNITSGLEGFDDSDEGFLNDLEGFDDEEEEEAEEETPPPGNKEESESESEEEEGFTDDDVEGFTDAPAEPFGADEGETFASVL